MPQPQDAQEQVQSAPEQQQCNGAIRSKGILRHRHICMNVVAETPADCSDSMVEGTELAEHHAISGTAAAAQTASIFIVNPFSYQLEEKEFIDQRSRIIAWEKEYCDPSSSEADIRYSRVSLKDDASVSITAADNASGKQKMPFRTAWEKGIRNRMRDACVSAHDIAKMNIWDSMVEHFGKLKLGLANLSRSGGDSDTASSNGDEDLPIIPLSASTLSASSSTMMQKKTGRRPSVTHSSKYMRIARLRRLMS